MRIYTADRYGILFRIQCAYEEGTKTKTVHKYDVAVYEKLPFLPDKKIWSEAFVCVYVCVVFELMLA